MAKLYHGKTVLGGRMKELLPSILAAAAWMSGEVALPKIFWFRRQSVMLADFNS
jgi:hypothetical protein